MVALGEELGGHVGHPFFGVKIETSSAQRGKGYLCPFRKHHRGIWM